MDYLCPTASLREDGCPCPASTNLAIWFGLHMLFGEVREIGAYGLTVHMPVLTSVDWPAVALAAVAAIATFRLKLGMIWTLALCCVLGVLYYLAFA